VRARTGQECFLFRFEAPRSEIFNSIRHPFSAQSVPDGTARHATRATKGIEIPILDTQESGGSHAGTVPTQEPGIFLGEGVVKAGTTALLVASAKISL